MPGCPDILALQAFVDRQLAEAPERAIAEHLASCHECAEAAGELRLACLPLTALAEEPPTDLLQRLLAAVADLEPLPSLSCDTALEWVSLRLDGELSHEQMQRLEAHLYACSECYRAAQELETAADILRVTEPAAAPEGLLQRVQAAAALAAPPRPARQPALRRWGMSLAGVAAAAAILLAVIFNTITPTATTTPVVAAAPHVEMAAPAARPVAPPPTIAASHPASQPGPAVAPPVRVASSRPTRALGSTPPSAPRPAPASAFHGPAAVHAPEPPAAPAILAVGHSRPVTLALAPAAGSVAERPVVALTVPSRPEVTLAPLPRVTEPRPARATLADEPKPTPTVAVAARPPSAPARSHNNWVTRPTSDEREVYRSEDADTRLADARKALEQDLSDIRKQGRAPSFKRWALH